MLADADISSLGYLWYTISNDSFLNSVCFIAGSSFCPQSYLHVVITYVSHVFRQHSFGLQVRKYGKHRTH